MYSVHVKTCRCLSISNSSLPRHIILSTSFAYGTFLSPSPSLCLPFYLSVVHSQLCYCYLHWRPRLLRHYMLGKKSSIEPQNSSSARDNSLGYKARLYSIQMLPLVHWQEFLDIMFLVKCLKNLQNNLDLCSFIPFVKSHTKTAVFINL